MMAEFVRALIRGIYSGDVLWLAIRQAQGRTGAGPDEVEALIQAVRRERDGNHVFGKNFMPEF